MAAYYNEIDPFAAAWLAELMRAGLIADGEIDTRSIEHVDAADLAGFQQCHFFAGIGGWSHALRLAGWPDEREIWTGSCPCQPFSRAGKQRGIADRRHLWPEFYRLIRERRPAIVVGEQVAGPAGLAWWDIVSHDLEDCDYACGAVDFPAASVGAPHIRQRLYWCGLSDTGRDGRQGRIPGRQDAARETEHRPAGRDGATGRLGDADGEQRQRPAPEPAGAGLPQPANTGVFGGLVYPDRDRRAAGQRDNQTVGHRPAAGAAGEPGGFWAEHEWRWCRDGKYRPIKPGLEPLAHGLPGRMAVLRGIGNAIVPQQAAAFIKTVMEEITT